MKQEPPRTPDAVVGRESDEYHINDYMITIRIYGYESKPWYLVNPKIAGIYGCSSHYCNVSIGIDP